MSNASGGSRRGVDRRPLKRVAAIAVHLRPLEGLLRPRSTPWTSSSSWTTSSTRGATGATGTGSSPPTAPLADDPGAGQGPLPPPSARRDRRPGLGRQPLGRSSRPMRGRRTSADYRRAAGALSTSTSPSSRLSDVNRRFLEAICALLGIGTPSAGRSTTELRAADRAPGGACAAQAARRYVSGPARAAPTWTRRCSRPRASTSSSLDYAGYPEYPQLPRRSSTVSVIDLLFRRARRRRGTC